MKKLVRAEAPNPWWAFAVGVLYVFRTAPGHRLLRELDAAVRRYAADPSALVRLMRDGERGEVIDVEVIDAPPRKLLR